MKKDRPGKAACVAAFSLLLGALPVAGATPSTAVQYSGAPAAIVPTLGWSTFLGSAFADYGEGVAFDGGGNVYVTGRAGGTWGTPLQEFTAFDDAFVAKLGPDGTPLWHTYLGSSTHYAGGSGIALDAGGNVYVAGGAFASWGAPLQDLSGVYDTFVAKLSPSGALLWHTFLGAYGSGSTPTGEVSHALAVDAAGDVFVAGRSYAAWGGDPVRAFSGSSDAYVAKMSTAGELQWHTFLGSAGFDYARAIALGAGGLICVTGSSSASWGAPSREHAGLSDVFVAGLDPSGALVWNTFLGSADWDQPGGVAVGGGDEVFVTGESPAPWGAPTRDFSGYVDAFVARLGAGGALEWNAFLGSEGDDRGRAVAALGDGGVCAVGDSDATWGTPERAHAGLKDVFVAVLDGAGQAQWNLFLGSGENDNVRGLAISGAGAVALVGRSTAAWGNPLNPFSGTFDALVAVIGAPTPGQFGKSGPAGAASGQARDLTLTWTPAPGATHYEYCCDTTDDNACTGGWVGAGANTGVQASELRTNTTYYWQVRAGGNGGVAYADAGAWWSFSTENLPPTLGLLGDAASPEGKLLGFSLAASDPDSATLRFGASILPAGSTLDPETGAFSWTPGYDQAGNHEVTFLVSDEHSTDSQTVTITVRNPAGPVFSDDFADGAAPQDWRTVSGGWLAGGGVYAASSLTSKNLARIVPLDPPARAIGAGIVQASVRITAAAPGAGPNGMLVFGYRDPGHYRWVRITRAEVLIGQTGAMGGVAGGTKRRVARSHAVDRRVLLTAKIHPNGWVRVYEGAALTPVAAYRFLAGGHASVMKGGVGLAAVKAGTVFDDVRVWEDSALAR